MKTWRFRAGLFGTIVLQRSYTDYDVPFPLWRDATIEDLRDYYEDA